MHKNLSKPITQKAILLLLVLTVVTACRRGEKTHDPEPKSSTTIQYKYNANVSSTYIGNYTDTNGVQVDTLFTGTTFSKTIKTDKTSGFTDALFSFYSIDQNFPIKGSVSILVNNNIVLHHDIILDSVSTGFSYNVVVFKDDK